MERLTHLGTCSIVHCLLCWHDISSILNYFPYAGVKLSALLLKINRIWNCWKTLPKNVCTLQQSLFEPQSKVQLSARTNFVRTENKCESSTAKCVICDHFININNNNIKGKWLCPKKICSLSTTCRLHQLMVIGCHYLIDCCPGRTRGSCMSYTRN